MEAGQSRASWLGAPAAFKLNMACIVLAHAFGHHFYLVGSALQKRDYRDVDVRCMLPDAFYDLLFPEKLGTGEHNAMWAVLSTSISVWLREQTGLPVDFQFQKRTEANAKFPGREHRRHPLGILIWGGERADEPAQPPPGESEEG